MVGIDDAAVALLVLPVKQDIDLVEKLYELLGTGVLGWRGLPNGVDIPLLLFSLLQSLPELFKIIPLQQAGEEAIEGVSVVGFHQTILHPFSVSTLMAMFMRLGMALLSHAVKAHSQSDPSERRGGGG